MGQRQGRVWHARKLRPETGGPARVEFDGLWVLRREERQGDVIGFLHTHPGLPATPSQRDVRTMRGWCSAFGKPLLCVILGRDGARGFRFKDDQSNGVELRHVELFPRGIIVGVD